MEIVQSKFILQKKKFFPSATHTEWQPFAPEYLKTLPPSTFPHSANRYCAGPKIRAHY